MRALQAGDVSYKEQSAATAARARVELDGVSAEKSVAAARVSGIYKRSRSVTLEYHRSLMFDKRNTAS